MLFVSCAHPIEVGEKLNTAKHYLDSLQSEGAENSPEFRRLQFRMSEAEKIYEEESKLLFKHVVIMDSLSNELNSIITDARHFVVTDYKSETEYLKNKLNAVKLEVEIEFELQPDVLSTASLVDEVIRRNVMNAKLIRVKIIE